MPTECSPYDADSARCGARSPGNRSRHAVPPGAPGAPVPPADRRCCTSRGSPPAPTAHLATTTSTFRASRRVCWLLRCAACASANSRRSNRSAAMSRQSVVSCSLRCAHRSGCSIWSTAQPRRPLARRATTCACSGAAPQPILQRTLDRGQLQGPQLEDLAAADECGQEAGPIPGREQQHGVLRRLLQGLQDPIGEAGVGAVHVVEQENPVAPGARVERHFPNEIGGLIRPQLPVQAIAAPVLVQRVEQPEVRMHAPLRQRARGDRRRTAGLPAPRRGGPGQRRGPEWPCRPGGGPGTGRRGSGRGPPQARALSSIDCCRS